MQISNVITIANHSAVDLAQGGSPDIPWVRILVVLLLCIALAVAAVGFVRLRHGMAFLPERFINPMRSPAAELSEKKRLVISERISAGPTSQFVILTRGTQKYLLHVSQQGVTEIDRFTDDEADQ